MAFDTELVRRAHEFALTQDISSTRGGGFDLWPILRRKVANVRRLAARLEREPAACSEPAHEWLIDHAAYIELQEMLAERLWPHAVLRKLPKMAETGHPRLVDLASCYLDAARGHVEVKALVQFVEAYQDVQVLTTEECHQLENALRVAILMQLSEASEELARRYEVCRAVARLLDEIGRGGGEEGVRRAIDRFSRGRALGAVELVHLVHHLSEWEPDSRELREWLAAHVAHAPESLERLTTYEAEWHAEIQVLVGNLVQSLHALERVSWPTVIPRLSRVEACLRTEPTCNYIRLEPTSRNVLTNQVSWLSEVFRLPETTVAETAVSLARRAWEEAGAPEASAGLPREAFVAHYLCDPDGMHLLRAALKERAKPRPVPQIALRRRPLRSYLLGMAFLFVVILWALLAAFTDGFRARAGATVLLGVLLALPVSEWVISLVHEGIRRLVRPVPLLRLDFSEGLPEDARTMIVLPVIWGSEEDVDEAFDKLELHHLTQRGDNLYLAVLSDLKDAERVTLPEDERLLNRARVRLEELRRKYGAARFFWFHRQRVLNRADGVYMGWERKRGKLVEFIELLRGRDDTTFCIQDGSLDVLPTIRYLFTADLDTELPIGAVGRLVGTMHLPYNRPRLNARGTRVTEGYGVLQPAVAVSPKSSQVSHFARLLSGETGVDPYAFAISNPYQDWFSRGLFVGKGLIHVDAFHAVLCDRIPDNRVLSHDILEGGFLRAGLVADVEVVESQPATLRAYMRRAHRWVRGDWQLIYWLRRVCRNRRGEKQPVDLCGFTRWNIVDHVRHSLVRPALVLLLLCGGLGVLPGPTYGYGLVILATVFLPLWRQLESIRPGEWDLRAVVASLLQSLIMLVVLPFMAVVEVDACVRALYRMGISRRRLLEWIPSSQVDRSDGASAPLLYEPAGYLVAIACSAPGLFGTLGQILSSALALVAWLPAHAIARLVARRPRDARPAPDPALAEHLRDVAAAMWRFYERYVDEEEHHLPPDNVQFEPVERVAHRTSPTNIGLYLLCAAAAADLGLIGREEAVSRLEKTMATLAQLDRWHGHLFNWYDTRTLAPLAPRYVSTVDSGNLVCAMLALAQALREWAAADEAVAGRAQALAEAMDGFVRETDFAPLYRADLRLFSLGYHADRNELENIVYDLLASEVRQASFIAVASGQVPASHWFALSRTMTRAGRFQPLLSWSGTMFEYLMPALLMRHLPQTLWDETYRGVVWKQIDYARRRGVPFGISESGFYAFDRDLNYQYRAFGVPGLGLDRGLDRHLVVAPYASMLSLSIAPDAVADALAQLRELGALGPYGYYEAVDFTADRLPPGERYKIVRSFMAHHQGMAFIAIANYLKRDIWVERFHRLPLVRAAEYMLYERMPKRPALLLKPVHAAHAPNFDQPVYARHARGDDDVWNALTNGRLTTFANARGEGGILWNGIAVTRYRADRYLPYRGPVAYVRDVDRGGFFRTSLHGGQGHVAAEFRPDKSVWKRVVDGLETEWSVVVAPDGDVEIRRLVLKNLGREVRRLEITYFAELALAKPAADLAHPSFQRLFVETGWDDDHKVLWARRRPETDADPDVYAAFHLFAGDDEPAPVEWDSHRARFVGRGGTLAQPEGLWRRLGAEAGSVADPAAILRTTVAVEPGAKRIVYVVTALGAKREEVVEQALRMRHTAVRTRAAQLAWVRAQIDLRQLHLTPDDVADAMELLARFVSKRALSPARKAAIEQNELGPSGLWAHGISGDVPIVVVRLASAAEVPFVAKVARLTHYLAGMGFPSDLVVIDETTSSYRDEMRQRIQAEMARRGVHDASRLAVLKSDQLSSAERALIEAVAVAELRAGGPSVGAQLHGGRPEAAEPVMLASDRLERGPDRPRRESVGVEGEFSNGYGAFVEGGRAYRMRVTAGTKPPRPWTNVMANPSFGTLVTELGTGYTWWRNSREFKLTPWRNDPAFDTPGEVVYLVDLDDGAMASATPSPAGGDRSYVVTHQPGLTTFQSEWGRLACALEVYADRTEPVKWMRLRLRNEGDTPRRIRVVPYAEWVLGVDPLASPPLFVVRRLGADVIAADNRYQEAFRGAMGFLAVGGAGLSVGWLSDKARFLGGGSYACPDALAEEVWRGEDGPAAMPCAAIARHLELAPGEAAEVVVLIGAAASEGEVLRLARRATPEQADESLRTVKAFWSDLLDRVQVRTPDRAFDILMNGWLLYQVLSCRLWARTAFYQAGGAFGFRDQLQDALALVHAWPEVLREQILRAARHQYAEGDVQHWWHEELGKGIRTRFSDDLLWLPYAVSRYLEATGDVSVLDERAPYLVSAPLGDGELERYEDIVWSDAEATIAQHMVRAVERALHFGDHGLPLIGIGDWNDGLSRVGARGRGESVWLAWFLADVLRRMGEIDHPDIAPHRARFASMRERVLQAANEAGWDGQWYRRAVTDDGVWLGAAGSTACRIDAIAQSWAVISGGAPPERALRAMESFDRELVDRRLAVAHLLRPAFREMRPSPGYIQGYPPGLRENGGQYTHGVIWSIIAWAMLGRGDAAHELYALLNPIHHTGTPRDVERYGNEPYVMSADVYTSEPNVGQGGWSWYTGAASWMYQAGLEAILGIRRRGAQLWVSPCIPDDWPGYEVVYRFGSSKYHIRVEPSPGAISAKRGGQPSPSGSPRRPGDVELPYVIDLVDDGQEHEVVVRLSSASAVPKAAVRAGDMARGGLELRAPSREVRVLPLTAMYRERDAQP
ncbi:GH36-type glycosyl hydrolase domain-containing protein [Alicyclobacillus vulcanalis]|uniref:Cyclic beta-1,2-glucan synthetase n=1 Tax=Alicyclobacillus vulcanalis TaxID=252246 RepID=A0A1N7N5Y1_9BACL|nr:glucoamylase family protein [Alicyclobacillus vulcanalis]SIS93756.1 cyclic beta-1,2-glucan synthetase [Alicyclobacillus vulcanalis]